MCLIASFADALLFCLQMRSTVHLQMLCCLICRCADVQSAESVCLSADFDVDLQILWFVVCISVLCFTPFADALLVSLQISGVFDLQKLHNLICSFTGL